MGELKPKDLGRAIVMAQHFCEEENCTLCRDALAAALEIWAEWNRRAALSSGAGQRDVVGCEGCVHSGVAADYWQCKGCRRMYPDHYAPTAPDSLTDNQEGE